MARRVRDFLADSIEPALSDEIKVDTPDGLLHVTVKPVKRRQPYAHVSRGERHFLIRIGDRTRPTTREEIFERHGSPHGSGTDRLTLARERLSKLRSDAIKKYLLEYPVSVLRLASTLLKMTGAPTDDGRFVIRLALSGLRGWKLGPHSPESLSFQVCSYRQFQEDDPDVEPNLLVRGCEEIIKEADRCAFSLVRSIYEAFGYEEDKIPVEFDRTTKRLVLSE